MKSCNTNYENRPQMNSNICRGVSIDGKIAITDRSENLIDDSDFKDESEVKKLGINICLNCPFIKNTEYPTQEVTLALAQTKMQRVALAEAIIHKIKSL